MTQNETYADMNARHARETAELKLRQLDERAAFTARRKAQREIRPLIDWLYYRDEGGPRSSLSIEECRAYAIRARIPLREILATAKQSGLTVLGADT